MTTRRRFSDKFKATVALEAIDGLTGVFSDKINEAENRDDEINVQHSKEKETGFRKQLGNEALMHGYPSTVFRLSIR